MHVTNKAFKENILTLFLKMTCFRCSRLFQGKRVLNYFLKKNNVDRSASEFVTITAPYPTEPSRKLSF